MKKVITYGTFDLLHQGHINILNSAKKLGDYLVVGVTSECFDLERGKINVKQSLMERVQAVRETGIADEIIIEEYEGQKIDDIKKHEIEIFAIGSDWTGKFDYINEFCQVVYLPRTEGVSSSEIRSKERELKLGIVGESNFLNKVIDASSKVNGMKIVGVCTKDKNVMGDKIDQISFLSSDYELLVEHVDALYIRSKPEFHYEQIKYAIEKGKHVLVESPIALKEDEISNLYALAEEKSVVLMEAIKTAYMTAFERLLALVKGKIIGDIISVESTCTSVREYNENEWNGFYEWGPTAFLPVFKMLGNDFKKVDVVARKSNVSESIDGFMKFNFLYDKAVATVKLGDEIKSEGELIVSGTKGYLFVPAPWWKTDYFEIRYENENNNKKYFFQLDGEGIQEEFIQFMNLIEGKHERVRNVSSDDSHFIGKMIELTSDPKQITII